MPQTWIGRWFVEDHRWLPRFHRRSRLERMSPQSLSQVLCTSVAEGNIIWLSWDVMRQTYWDGYIYIYYINIITQPSQCYLDMSENGGHPNLPVVLRGNMMIKHESGLGVTHYWRNQSICRFSKFIQHTHRDNAQQLSLGFHFLQVGFHLKNMS